MTRGVRYLGLQLMVFAVVVVPTRAMAAPTNDNFADAQEIVGTTATVSGTTLDATTEEGEPSHGEFASGSSIWYRWTAPQDMTVLLDLCDSGFDTLIAVYTGTDLSALTQVARNQDAYKCRRVSRSRVTLSATAGTTYYVAVDGEFDETGAVVLKLVDLSPPNDNFSAGQPLRGYVVETTGDNEYATVEEGEPDPFGGRLDKTLWYRWTAPTGGIVTIDTCRSSFDTTLAVYTGGAVTSLEKIASNDNECGGQSRVIIRTTSGATFQIQVGAPGNTRSLKLDIGMPRTGAYEGKTGFGDRKPISFKLQSNGLVVSDFTFSLDLDCYQGGRYAGEFRLRDISIEKMEVGRDDDGAAFAANLKVKFKDGGYMTIGLLAGFSPPDRAAGKLKVRIELPNNITCKHWLGTVKWSARR